MDVLASRVGMEYNALKKREQYSVIRPKLERAVTL